MMGSKTGYETVQLHDEHDDSSTEVDESLLGDEKQQPRRRPAKERRRRLARLLSPLRWAIDTALLLAILGLLVRDRRLRAGEPPVDRWDFGQDFTGVGPRSKSGQRRELASWAAC